MKTLLHPAQTRGRADYGWLHANYSFSFARFYDPERVHFGALRVLNDDTIEGGMGFGTHPHDNMEIVTIPLEGALRHRDSMGHTGVIHKGDVQVMSAGTGIQHSEFNAHPDRACKLFQIWVFPKKRNVAPRYEQKSFPLEERRNRLQFVVAPDGADGALSINQDAWFALAHLDAGREISYPLHLPGNGVYLLAIEGKVEVGGHTLGRRDALGIWDTERFTVKALENAELLFIEVPMQDWEEA